MNDIDRKKSVNFIKGLAQLIKETGVEIAAEANMGIDLYDEKSGRYLGEITVEADAINLYCGDDEPIDVIQREQP